MFFMDNNNPTDDEIMNALRETLSNIRAMIKQPEDCEKEKSSETEDKFELIEKDGTLYYKEGNNGKPNTTKGEQK